MLLIFGLLLVITFGYLLSVILVQKIQPTERIGLSFLLGFGVFTLLMYCYSTVGFRITLASTILVLAVCILLLSGFGKILKRKLFINLSFNEYIKSFLRLPVFEKVIVMAIAGLGAGSLIITTYFPVYIWDALALYDFRGKIIAQLGFYTQIAKNFYYFGGYPLFTSLSHTLVYLFGGSNPQFLYSFMYISFIFIFYSTLRGFVSRKIALVSSLLMATTPVLFDHSTFAYTNLPYTIFLATGNIYLFFWFVKKKPIGYLILAAVLTGLSTWTRGSEPFWMVNIFILGMLSVYKLKKYLFPTIIYIVSFLPIREPWNLISYYQSASPEAAKVSPMVSEVDSYAVTLWSTKFDAVQVKEVAVFLYQNVIVSWYPLLFLFAVGIIVNFRDFFKKNSSFFLGIILLHFLLLTYGAYIFSFNYAQWVAIPDSARRMAMFFMPMMTYYIGLALGDIGKSIDL